MKLYVFKVIPGSFVEYEDEIDAQYWEGKIGTTYEDYEDGKWVLLSNEQAKFHRIHPEASVKQVMQSPLEYAKE